MTNINAPELPNLGEHYRKGGIECLDAIKACMTPEAFQGFLRGNILKYLWRYEHRGGATDLAKANHYLLLLRHAQEEQQHEHCPCEANNCCDG